MIPLRLPSAPTRRWSLRIGLAALGLSVAALALFAGVRPDLHVIEQVSIQGHQRATANELRHLVQIPNGTRVWGVDLAQAATGAERHPWVARAEARLQWPATVTITVEERVPVALLRSDRLVYLDLQGQPIAQATPSDLDYPVISGLSQDLYDLHPDLPGRVVQSALELVEALDQVEIPSERISEVVFSRTAGFTVYLVGGARLLFDLDDFPRQARRIVELRARGVSLDGPVHIDLAPQTMAIVRPLELANADG